MTLSPEIFKTIRKLHLFSSKVVDEMLKGAYKSAFKGKGITFEEVKEYIPGDDVRSIDWNVTARMNYPFIKLFKEERALTVTLLVDVSSSLSFGSINQSKMDVISQTIALIIFSAIRNHDKVGLILFSDTIKKYIPPKTGVKHGLLLLRELLAHKNLQQEETHLNTALHFFGKIQKKKGICFILSDFIDSYSEHLMTLISKKHDLIAISINDPMEITFPKKGLVQLKDLESGNIYLMDTSKQLFQQKIKKQAKERLLSIENLMKKLHSGYIPIRTDKPALKSIYEYFLWRKKLR